MNDRVDRARTARAPITRVTSWRGPLRDAWPVLPFLLTVLSLPFGRSAELGVVACLAGCIVLARRPAQWRAATGIPLVLLLLAAYIAAALLSAADALMPDKSWGTVVAVLRFVPLGVYAALVLRDRSRLQSVYLATAVVLAWWVIDAWLQALTGWSLGGPAEAERVSGIFGAGNLKLGPALAVLSPFALWVAWRRWRLMGLVLAALLLLGPILLAGSRAAWLCYALVLLAFLIRASGSPRRLAIATLAAIVLATVAGGIAWHSSGRFHERMQRTLAAFHGGSRGLDQALSGRLDIWRTSGRMIAAHPFNGVGVRGFRYAYPMYAPTGDHFLVAEPCGPGEGACHPHQIVLEILTETGVLGLALWLAGVVVALRAWRRADPRAREAAFPASVALGAMLFPLNTHLAFYSAWWGLLFAWLLALWCAALTASPEPFDA